MTGFSTEFQRADRSGRLGNPDVTLSEKEMLGSANLLDMYRKVPKEERLKVIELKTRPAGLSLLAGRQPGAWKV